MSATGPGRAVLTSRDFTWSGVSAGLRDSTRAADPAVMALANDVPEPLKYAVPTRPDGKFVSMNEPGTRLDTTDPPGAARSGFGRPLEAVGPAPEKFGTESSFGLSVVLSRTAPTVMTKGSSAGLLIVPAA